MTTSCPWIGTGYFNPPGSSGSGTNGIIAQRYSIAELKTVEPSAIASGTMTFVATVRDSYYYDASSTLTADDITVIAPDTGSGRWIRMNLGNETWRRQATWFIDSTYGHDEADGTTAETAIQTHAELKRRWGPGRALLQPSGDTVEITILGDLPASDPIEFDLEVHGNTLVRYRGATTPTNIVVDDVRNLDAASQTLTAIFTETDLLSYVGQRLRIVTPSGEAYAWILATEEAATSALISAPALVDLDAVPFQTMPAIVDVSGSDSFFIDELTSANLGPVRGVRVVSDFPPKPAVVFQDLRLGGEGIDSVNLALSVAGVDFAGCHLADLLLFGAQTELTSCRLSTMAMVNGLFNLHACVALQHEEMAGVQISNANVALDSQNVWYGISMSLEGSTVKLKNPDTGTEPALSVFEASGQNGIQVDATSTVVTNTLVWGELGSGSQYGWYVSPGGRVFYDSDVLPTLSGAAGDVVVGGVERHYSTSPDLPFFNIDNGAAFVER